VIISAVAILAERSLGMVEATIEDLAFSSRYSKESDEVGREDCLSEASSAALRIAMREWR